MQGKAAILHAQRSQVAAVVIAVDMQHGIAVGAARAGHGGKVRLPRKLRQFHMIDPHTGRIDKVSADLFFLIYIDAQRQAVSHRQAAGNQPGILGAIERLQRANLGGRTQYLAVTGPAIGGQRLKRLIADRRCPVQARPAAADGALPDKALPAAQAEQLPGNKIVVRFYVLQLLGAVGLIVVLGAGARQISRCLRAGGYRNRLVRRCIPQRHAQHAVGHINFSHNAEGGCSALQLPAVCVGMHTAGSGVNGGAAFRRQRVDCPHGNTRCTVAILLLVPIRVQRKGGVQIPIVQLPVGVGTVQPALAAHRKAAQRGGVACQISEGDIQRTAPAQQHPKRACGQQGGGQNDCCHKIPQRC